MVWPFRSAQDRLDEEAAGWASRMRGPERERHREAFELWYSSSPAHAEAFDEASAAFDEAGILKQGEVARARKLPQRQSRNVPLRYALGAFVAAAVVALIFLVSAYAPPPLPDVETAHRYATADEAREVRLPDGSRMTLARQSIAVLAFTRDERRITLERGRGRFSVAHEARPFRVVAGPAEVVARGTVFEVSVAAGGARVALIEGSVDVSYRSAQSEQPGRRVRRLQPGELILVTGPAHASDARPAQRPARAQSAPQPDSSIMLQFDDTPLAEAVAEANLHSRTRIGLADASLGELRITGAFRAGDGQGFAESLAAAFGLRLDRRPDGTFLLYANARPHRDS